jgi:hypothetical protein
MAGLLSGTQGALTINTADVADDAITLAKMAPGTDGQIITYDASGNPSAVGPGTDGQVLTSTGAGSPPAFEAIAGGGFEFVSSTTVSGASIEWETLSGNYDYRLQFRNVTLAADAQLIMQFGTGGTPTYATANYQTQYARFEQAAAGYAGNDGSGQAHITLGASQNGSTPRSGYVEIYDLANSSVFTSVWGILNSENNGGTELLDIFGGRLETAQADNSIKLDETAGTTFNGGSIALFRRPNA